MAAPTKEPKTATAPAKSAEPVVKKVKVRTDALIWNGRIRIRPGTVFEVPEGTILPKCCKEVTEEKTEAVDLGKRERDAAPTNSVKDLPAKP